MVSGCGSEKADEGEEVELIDPVGIAAPYVYASRRDLVTSKIVSGKVVPKVYTVSFPSDQRFEVYEKLPGEEVKKGDTVILASTEAIDKKIKDQEEKIKKSEESYNETLEDLNKQFSEAKADLTYNEEIMERIEDEPTHPQYVEFRQKVAYSTATYEKLDLKLRQTKEYYALDSAHEQLKLDRLYEEKKDVLATAEDSGRIVAVRFMDYEEKVNKGTAVAAIGDFSQLEVKTEEVTASEIKRAEDVYALVNGERFEAMFRELTAEEKEASQDQATRYSTFLLSDPEGKVKVGDLVTVVIITAEKRDVISVPNNAISTDENGTFVYVFDGENNIYTPVKTGLKSGVYTEIESGLSEGEMVISDLKVTAGKRTHKLEKGSVSTTFNEVGFLYYTINESIKSDVENGTVYVDEVLVKRYEKVTKGQPIAKVHVVSDDIGIRRMERTILRANEDLQELIKNNDSEDKNGRAIKKQQESIADLTEKLDKMKSDGAKTTIDAPFDGIITGINSFEEGDILLKDASVGNIAAEKNCFIIVEDKAGVLSVGNVTTIEYEDENGQKAIATGDVVSVCPAALPLELNQGYSLITVSSEDLAKISAANKGTDGWWIRSTYKVTAAARSVDNVVLVPKNAVKLDGGVAYVKMMNENGEPEYVSFVPGGSDNNNYWVAEGLSEGMEICLD